MYYRKMHKTLMYHLIDFCKINNYVTTIQVNKQNSASIPETLVRSFPYHDPM